MPVDTSMYGMIKPIDVMGSIEGGMKMRDLIDERKKKSALQDAYKQGMKVGPDGKVSMDHNMTASALAQGGYGREAYEAQQQGQSEQQKQMEAHVKNAQYGAQVLGAARNENEWNQGLQHLQTIMDVSTLPPYSPQNQKMLVDSAMTLQDRLQQQNKDRDFNAGRQDRKRAEEMDLAKLGIVQGHQERMQGNQFAQQEKMAGLTAQQQERQAMLKAVADKAGKGAENYVPGLGTAMNADDAKKLKDSKEMKMKFDRQIGEMIDLRKKYGVEYFNREAVGRGQQLSKDLLLTYKNLAKLGVLSKSDEEIVNAIIPSDPLGQDMALGQDPILHQLEKFKGDLDSDYQNTLATRLKTPDGASKGIDFNKLPEDELDKMVLQLGGRL